MIFARLSRIVPLLIILAIVAAIIYLVAIYKYSPNRAKEILIKAFTWITGILSGFFALVCAYALLDRNELILDLGISFLITALIGLGVVQICRAVFIKHHPHWKKKPMKTSKVDDRPRRPFKPPWVR